MGHHVNHKSIASVSILTLILFSGCEFDFSKLKRKKQLAPPTASELAKRNGEVLQEMIRVVSLKEPDSPEFFGGLVNSMNQGASFEGIYNGLIHNNVYRGTEETSEPASFRAVEAFIDQMLIFQAEALSQTPRGDLILSFKKSSLFTLKRILGDEAIKFMRAFKSRAELAEWYSSWALSMNRYKIDFGLSLRNNTDQRFHRNFAMNATQDTLDWEVLNRLHRLMNETGKK